jgi:hypothetical protein
VKTYQKILPQKIHHKVCKSLLFIHPDDGRFFGTQGCIGLQWDKKEL